MSTQKERSLKLLKTASIISDNYQKVLGAESGDTLILHILANKWRDLACQLFTIISDEHSLVAVDKLLSELVTWPLHVIWEALTERLALINSVNVGDALAEIREEYKNRKDPIECAQYIIECINNQFGMLERLNKSIYPRMGII